MDYGCLEGSARPPRSAWRRWEASRLQLMRRLCGATIHYCSVGKLGENCWMKTPVHSLHSDLLEEATRKPDESQAGMAWTRRPLSLRNLFASSWPRVQIGRKSKKETDSVFWLRRYQI